MKDSGFLQIDPLVIEDNLIKLISAGWMLVTAGDKEKFNTMTANWGGMGYLWNRPVVFVFVRPERYTYQFMERSEEFTLSFFNEKYRSALNICGSKSGRDCDKIAEASLTPLFTESGNPAFSEARLVLECRKLYADLLSPEAFIDREPVAAHYSGKAGIHKLYIAEILRVWKR
ncbi:MAG: flavin reductase family protein [Bacteroidales bacterium]|nr:flavin reductase family protein [Bacteroidales bacterium]MDD3989153.1 flavin reductase family protein [Bacteroidales bacterium]MDD4638599.1 flavin reductase family protein [Bacteroidales bacterium]